VRIGCSSIAFGATPLSSTTAFYFVVSACDAGGNRDHNRREQRGTNLCRSAQVSLEYSGARWQLQRLARG